MTASRVVTVLSLAAALMLSYAVGRSSVSVREVSSFSDWELLQELYNRYTYAINVALFVTLISYVVFLFLLGKFLYWFFRAAIAYVFQHVRRTRRDISPVYQDRFEPLISVDDSDCDDVNDRYGMVFEKYVPGSEFVPSQLPKFQVEIYASDDDVYGFVGNATRVGNFCLTAHHVVLDRTSIRLKRGDNHVDVAVENLKFISEDIAWFPVSQRCWSMLGAVSAKIPKRSVQQTLQAQIVSQSKKTMGELKPHPAVGFVIYKGSTCSGFSGAPYYIHNEILGVHIGSRSVNLGVDAQYIAAVMANMEEVVQEDSDEFIIEQMRRLGARGTRFQAKRSPASGDDWVVKVNGKYHVMDQDDLVDVQEYLDEVDKSVDLWTIESYADSGNSRLASAFAEALGQKASSRGARRERSLSPFKRRSRSRSLPRRSANKITKV